MPYTVLITDGIAPAGKAVLEASPQIKMDLHKGLKPEELLEKAKTADAIIVRSASTITKEVIAAAPNLKVIGRAGIGVDNIDVAAASARGVIVMNTPEGNTITTAEHTVSLMMSMARKIPEATATMRAGKWEKGKLTGVELYNKTLGLIGLGNIGAIVADRAQGLKMKVLAYDPFVSQDKAKKLGVELAEIDEVFKRADFISVHTPLTEKTRGLVNKTSIATMKKGVHLINCARGGIMVEEDVAEALHSGHVAGAAFDVFLEEPPKADNPLLTAPNVVLTPHLGASTGEAQENVSRDVAQQIVDYFTTGAARNAINFPSIKPEMVPLVTPWVRLGERLGSFISQWCHEGINTLEIEFSGMVAEYDVRPVEIAVAKGLLEPAVKEGVNFVNALPLARERGIQVTTRTAQAADYSGQIAVTVTTGGRQHTVSGVLFGANNPRIVRLDEFHFDARPQGHLIVIENEDKPGVIGNVGAMVGAAGINIARMGFGRENKGGKAISIVEADSRPEKGLLDSLAKLPNINRVTLVTLPD